MSNARRPAPLVDIAGLTISFPNDRGVQHAVARNVSFTISPGECVAIVGESGSGKSVTARALLNLVGGNARIEAERFLINGADARAFNASQWRRVRGGFAGLVMQDALTSLDPLRTIGKEVAEAAQIHGLARGAAALHTLATATLARVGVPDPEERARQYAQQLSGGLRQRALIAAAIAGQPRLIIADEPTTALDASVQAQVLSVLRQRRDEGAGLLLISHDLAVVAGIADRAMVMRDGVVLDSGPTQEVLNAPRHPWTRRLIAASPSASTHGYRLTRPVTAGGANLDAREPLPPRAAPDLARPVLEAHNLRKHYRTTAGGVFTALDGVSFTVNAGEVLGLVGESGSGKSTCAKIALGLLEPDDGEIHLLGAHWTGMKERARKHLRRKMQYIPQDPLSSFDPRHTVTDIIGENLRAFSGMSRRERVMDLLALVGLDVHYASRRPGQLSGGQRQRIAIARALAADPAIIICDEPVSALDVSIQAQVIDLLADLQAQTGVALLFITHDLGLVQHAADRVIILKDGRVVEQGDARAIFRNPSHSYTAELVAALPRLGFGLITSS
ncbi:ABC transporter ATP-binding protein [Camelimonas fluminis]|uniref:Dipeptide ABC transporter ATP-binding protein n=1 Tax=Camelimonas fluminis TaxID=1576911 RepID=A0ABV7UGR8_9HYPH|nr:ABC transporter ATP-binding protein [Camelimonas fluminis]GHE72545.1 ABC transporter ATP-binding protein [Camelimonas fluminis]